MDGDSDGEKTDDMSTKKTTNRESQGDKKKQIPLRLSNKLYAEIAAWADDEFRSVNGQIEYLLTECIKKRKAGAGNGK